MLDSFLLLNSLNDATTILGKAKRDAAHGSQAVYHKIYRAEMHINKQVAELLAPPPDAEVLSDAA